MKTRTQEKYEKAFNDLINSKNPPQSKNELIINRDFLLKALQEQAEEIYNEYVCDDCNRKILKGEGKLCYSCHIDDYQKALQSQREKFEEEVKKREDWIKDEYLLYGQNPTPEAVLEQFRILKEALNNQTPNPKKTLASDGGGDYNPQKAHVLNQKIALEDKTPSLKGEQVEERGSNLQPKDAQKQVSAQGVQKVKK